MYLWLWETIRWTDVVDIAILAFITYRVLLLLRGTRAFQALVGLLLLLLLFFLSEVLGLTAINWLLDTLTVYIVLAVIILFQQDIRRALARAGRLFPTTRVSAELPMLEELVKASFNLASRRIGALVAIERNAELGEYIEAAASVDGVVSHGLLLSIFHHTSPMHDGAVVIQKGRLSAAQAFLPLTQSKEVSRFFGTRHRAAIGLTEETDAICIVISEERGTVSLVGAGQVSPCADADELREKLVDIFQKDASRAPRTLMPWRS